MCLVFWLILDIKKNPQLKYNGMHPNNLGKQSGFTESIMAQAPMNFSVVCQSKNTFFLYLLILTFFIGPKYNTTETIALLSNIESCTSVTIDVGIIGPNGIGPLSKKPLDIITPYDPTVPPKDIKVEQIEHSTKVMILISWKASCHPVTQSYKVSILFKSTMVRLVLCIFNFNFFFIQGGYIGI